MTRVSLTSCLMILFFVASCAGKALAASWTAEERQRVVTITHKLEASPLDQSLFPERDWAKQWVIENPDVRIRMCTRLLVDLRRPRYKFLPEIVTQLMLSSAAFLIENPDHARDNLAEEVAGMQGVLKAYSAILKGDPNAHAKPLDDVLQQQTQGNLTDWVRETIKDCH